MVWKDYANRRWPTGLKRFLSVVRPMDSLGPNWREVSNIQYGREPERRLRFAIKTNTTEGDAAACVFASYLYHPARVGGDNIARWWNSPKIVMQHRDLAGWHRLSSILLSLGDRPDLDTLAGSMLCVLSLGEHWRHENYGAYNAGIGIIAGKAGRHRLYLGELRPSTNNAVNSRLLCTPRGISLGLSSTRTIEELGFHFRDLLYALEGAHVGAQATQETEIIKA